MPVHFHCPHLSGLLFIGFLIAATHPLPAAAEPRESFPAGLTVNDLNTYSNEYMQKQLALDGFLLRQPGAALVDMRNAQDFAAKHIKGSINLPALLMVPEVLEEIWPDKTQTVVTIGGDSFGGDEKMESVLPYVALRKAGYADVYHLRLARGGVLVADIDRHVSFASLPEPPAPEAILRFSLQDLKKFLPGVSATVLTAEGFSALRAQGEAVAVLDFREQPQAQHIAGSLSLRAHDVQPEKLAALLPDKTAPVVLVSERSFGASPAVDMTMFIYAHLRKQGYQNVRRIKICDGVAACAVQEWPWLVTADAAAMPVPTPEGAPSILPAAPPLGAVGLIPQGMSAEEFNAHMQGAGAAALTLDEFIQLRAQEPALVVLDIRAAEGYSLRHIKGARNLPLTEMTEHTLPQILPDKDVPIVMVCDESFAPTRRISMTLQGWPILKANGYTRVYRLNLWRTGDGSNRMLGDADITKQVEFEGSAVPRPAPPQRDEKMQVTPP